MRTKAIFITLMLVSLLTAACGTVATPVPNDATLEAIAAAETQAALEEAEEIELVAEDEDEDGETVAVEPTEAPTITAIPTSTPTEIPPTPTFTPVPTEVTEEAADALGDLTEEERELVLLVSRFGDPANGETLFNETYDTSNGPYACATCHYVDQEAMLIGPGLVNLHELAAERVEGQPAEVYVYNSIIYPNEYVVEGYNEGLMPQNYEELLTEQELYDLSSYILTLGQ